MPNPQGGGPPVVGCPRLLIQYIGSYSAYLEVVSTIRNQRTRHYHIFIGDDIQVYLMSDLSGQQIMILTTSGDIKVRKRLAVSKQTTHRVHMERFSIKKINEVQGKEQYRVEI
jgi:hypothetical protein